MNQLNQPRNNLTKPMGEGASAGILHNCGPSYPSREVLENDLAIAEAQVDEITQSKDNENKARYVSTVFRWYFF